MAWEQFIESNFCLAHRTDVAVIGGGPAGTATALALSRAGYDVHLIERKTQPDLQVGETLPPSIRLPLEALDLWQDFCKDGHLPSLGNRSAWGGEQPLQKDFFFNPYGNGWHVDRQRFDTMLWRAAQASGTTLLTGVRLTQAIAQAEGGWMLLLKSATGLTRLTAKFVVDATGRRRAFARKVGATIHCHDQLRGIVSYHGTTSSIAEADRLLLIESVETGWWYSAPLPNDRYVAVFVSDSDLISTAKLLSQKSWISQLYDAPWTRARLTGLEMLQPLHLAAADSSSLEPAGGSDWAAVGDAAASYDPLSAQGLERALRSGLRVAEAIAAKFHGREEVLNQYITMQAQTFADYLEQRQTYYSLERRWPTSVFWQRRHSLLPNSPLF